MFLFEFIAALWFFVFGSVIGSFMNVVVYRTPRGKSIIGPSRCPQCDNAIRWHDNVPIVGWFFLKGKCRDCGLPISFRYPTVEFVTACLFLVLAIAELFSGGSNLPGAKVEQWLGFTGLLSGSEIDWLLVGMVALHALLLSSLFCWALMCVDEQAIPRAQIWGLWCIGLAVPVVWPDIHPLSLTGEAVGAGDIGNHWGGFQTAVFGLSAAGVIYLAWVGLERYVVRHMFAHASVSQEANTAFCAGMGAIGLMLGWQAVVSILFLTALSRGIFALSSFKSAKLRATPLLIDVLLATVIHLCFWNRLWLLPSWPGAGSFTTALLGSAIALLVLTFAAPVSAASAGEQSCDVTD